MKLRAIKIPNDKPGIPLVYASQNLGRLIEFLEGELPLQLAEADHLVRFLVPQTVIDRFEAAEEFENRSGVKEGVGLVAFFKIVVGIIGLR